MSETTKPYYDGDDGGPAFPAQCDGRNYTGVTVRDYFAARAMAAMAENSPSDPETAERAYELADAMLAARKV